MNKNCHELVKINRNTNWTSLPKHFNHWYSGSSKANMLLNLIKHQQTDIEIYLDIYLYIKDPFESKYQLLINGG